MVSVALERVTKVFPGGTVALDDVSLEVAEGEFLVLLGPSGCGKSTLLRIVAGLESPTSGQVWLNGQPADEMPPKERGVAMVFQDYALYPHMDVSGNIEFPLRRAGVGAEERRRRVAAAAAALGIGDKLASRIGHLSGGQRQRVGIGRAIVREPRLFLLDEPLSNLDAGQRAGLRAEISGLAEQLGMTVIYVTHDQTEALTMADTVAILRRGVIQDVGTATAVYERPATAFVATFLGNPRMSLMSARVRVDEPSHVELVLGRQSLYLPWHDQRRRIVMRYHGEDVVLGVRAEAVTPVSADATENVLAGTVRSVEHHGHETLVYAGVGATAVQPDGDAGVDAVAGSANGHRPGVWSRFLSRLPGWAGPADESGGVARDEAGGDGADETGGDAGAGRHHRRSAEVPVRLIPYPRIRPGDSLRLAVDMDAVHFFNRHGDRIEAGWR